MKVAIMYSGGKDSNFALQHAIEKGWDVRFLVSVKPADTECYLYHFATVEHTPKQAEAAGIKHILTTCDVQDPKAEAEIAKEVIINEEKVDAVILGGVGLQETQIRSIREALAPYQIEVFASHAELTEEESLNQMLEKGFRFIISQYATEGLDDSWLGKEITKETLKELKTLSQKYGFNFLGEGGYYDTFCIGSPAFNGKEILIKKSHTEKVDNYSSYLVIDEAEIVPAAVAQIVKEN